MRELVTSIALAVALFCTGPFTYQAEAVSIPASSSVGPAPAGFGDGLNGRYWDADAINNAQADAVIAGGSPDATFTMLAAKYPRGPFTFYVDDSTQLQDFLGSDSASLSAAQTNTLETSVFSFTGFLKITSSFDNDPVTTPIDIDFRLLSDDGSRLSIGGITVLDNGGTHLFTGPTTTVSFEAEGLYPVDIIYYEHTGNAGFDWLATAFAPPGSGLTFGVATYKVLFTSNPYLSTIPEPCTLVLLGGGLVGIFVRRRLYL